MKKEVSYCGQYRSPRSDILALVPEDSRQVLDVGCGAGLLGASIKEKMPACRVVGIDIDKSYQEQAGKRLDKFLVGDVEDLGQGMSLTDEGLFDCIVFGDVLEHLRDPWQVVMNLVPILENRGVVIASLPNVGHWTTLFSLAFLGRWPYRDRGIHDHTHIRHFALNNARDLFTDAGFKVERVGRNYRLVESASTVNKVSRYLALPGLKNLLTFQYLLLCKKTDGQEGSEPL
jgi:2-polyprenyl-3-methyl-5-hydroxy-6-metoxy-1,4-benzoquinol methylase